MRRNGARSIAILSARPWKEHPLRIRSPSEQILRSPTSPWGIGAGCDSMPYSARVLTTVCSSSVTQLAHTQLAAFKVQQNIHYLLSLTVIVTCRRDRSGSPEYRRAPARVRFACLALSEDRVMFHQPDLVEGVFIAGVGEFMHRLRDGFVWLQAKLPDKNFYCAAKQHLRREERTQGREVYHSRAEGDERTRHGGRVGEKVTAPSVRYRYCLTLRTAFPPAQCGWR